MALYEELQKTNPVEAKTVGDWLTSYRSLRNRCGPWFKCDDEMERLFLEARRTPWNAAKSDRAERRLTDLKKACDEWKRWADSNMKPEELDNQISGYDLEVEKLLRTWLNNVRSQTKWTLRLKSGKAPEGYGLARTVSVYGTAWSRSYHDWSSATKQTYVANDKPDIKFDWTPGQPISLELRYDGWRGRAQWGPRCIYDDSFQGPLALWRLNATGRSAQDGFELTYEVIDCPGPPREAVRGLDPTSALEGK